MSNDPELCASCDDNFIVNGKLIKCGFCKKPYHNMCVQIKDTVSKAVSDTENLMWFCKVCLAVVSQNIKLAEKIQKIEEKTNAVFKTLEDLKCERMQNFTEIQMEQKSSYANALKEGVLVVKPTKPGESTETRKIIRQQINPAELGIGITSMRKAREGTVVIKCRNQEEANKLRKNLEPKISQNYQTSIPSKKNPQIKIVGIEEQYNEEELFKKLQQQNSSVISQESRIKLIVTKKMIKTYFAIVECDPETHRKILQKGEGRLYLDCRACRCYEYISVYRCYNCHQYNHTAKECKQSKACSNCGSVDHDTKSCKNDPECLNCKLCNGRYNLNSDTKHTAYDIKCPTYERYQEKERAKILYNSSDE